MISIATLTLTLLVVIFILRPLFRSEFSSASTQLLEEQALSDQKLRCLRLLKDLELDFATSKISQQDYNSMRQSIAKEFAEILEKPQKED